MRAVFFLLVLANLIFFAWSAGYFGAREEGREPQRLQNQMQPEKMTVTPVPPAIPSAPAATPAAPAPPAPPAPVPATPAAPAPVPATPAAPAAQSQSQALTQVCRRVDGLAAKDAVRLQLAAQGAGLMAAVMTADEQTWWVNVPGLPNKATADKKAGELKALGITDFHVMQGESGSFVISLGLFREEEAATQFLQALNRKGVKSARLTTRSKPSAIVRVELRGSDDQFGKHLGKLLAAAPGAAAAACP